MNAFLGQYEVSLEAGTRLRLPGAFARVLQLSTDPQDRVLLVPFGDHIVLIPEASELAEQLGTELVAVHWSQLLKSSVAESRVLPCPLVYDQWTPSRKLAEVRAALEEAARATRIDLTGREWEELVAEAFRSAGYHVQERVRLLGGEVDLLLMEVDEAGTPRLSIVECKQWHESRRPVGVSEVMRIFGFGEALEKFVHVENKLVVTTSSFTSNARLFSHVTDIELWELSKLIGWLRDHERSSSPQRLPLFTFRRMDHRGRFRLPPELMSSATIGESVIVSGLLDRVELWDRRKYEVAISRLSGDFHRFVPTLFG